MQNELAILEDASHPSIMNIYELLHDDKFYFIVSEYIRGGELYNYIVSNGNISEEVVRKIVQ